MRSLKQPSSKFIKVHCQSKNEQIIFGKASTVVKDVVSGKVIAAPTSGKTKIKARVVEVLE